MTKYFIIFISFLFSISSHVHANDFEPEPQRAKEAIPKERIEVGTRSISEDVLVEIQEKKLTLRENNEQDPLKTANDTETDLETTRVFSSDCDYWGFSYATAYHRLYCYSPYEQTIQIEDGSVWDLSPHESYVASNWLSGDSLLLTANQDVYSPYQFRLINRNTMTSVAASLYLGPYYQGPYTNWTTWMVFFSGRLMLQDGSRWAISPVDDVIFSHWALNDTIIVGINTDVDCYLYPYILINVETNSYVCAQLLN